MRKALPGPDVGADSDEVEPGAGARNSAEGPVIFSKAFNILTETVCVDGGKEIESGVTDMMTMSVQVEKGRDC
jgi:hypothetical protein